MQTKSKGYVDGFQPTVLSIRNAVKNYCFVENINITIDEYDPRWLGSTWYYQLEGDKRKIKSIENWLQNILQS